MHRRLLIALSAFASIVVPSSLRAASAEPRRATNVGSIQTLEEAHLDWLVLQSLLNLISAHIAAHGDSRLETLTNQLRRAPAAKESLIIRNAMPPAIVNSEDLFGKALDLKEELREYGNLKFDSLRNKTMHSYLVEFMETVDGDLYLIKCLNQSALPFLDLEEESKRQMVRYIERGLRHYHQAIWRTLNSENKESVFNVIRAHFLGSANGLRSDDDLRLEGNPMFDYYFEFENYLMRLHSYRPINSGLVELRDWGLDENKQRGKKRQREAVVKFADAANMQFVEEDETRKNKHLRANVCYNMTMTRLKMWIGTGRASPELINLIQAMEASVQEGTYDRLDISYEPIWQELDRILQLSIEKPGNPTRQETLDLIKERGIDLRGF